MIYFSSDQHFWHANVIKYCDRPYKSIEDMNEDLIRKWNETIGPEDTIYCLGDFSMAFRSIEIYSHRLMGQKILVPGNHDMLHSYHRKSRDANKREEWKRKYESWGWTILSEQTTLNVPGLATFNLCHHPYTSPEYADDKYAKWRPIDDGRILLCGHIHEKWKTKMSSKGTLMINVGVDVWGMKPVSVDQIKDLILQEA